MNYKEICDLINTVSESKLTSFEIEIDGVHLKMGKEEKVLVESNNAKDIIQEKVSLSNKENLSKKEVAKEVAVEKEGQKSSQDTVEDPNIVVVKSPIVGTFYASPAPDKDAFVQIGSMVKKGDTLCIIEAMKLMNDIEAEVEGEVVEILVEDEQMVEYGEPLFKIRK